MLELSRGDYLVNVNLCGLPTRQLARSETVSLLGPQGQIGEPGLQNGIGVAGPLGGCGLATSSTSLRC